MPDDNGVCRPGEPTLRERFVARDAAAIRHALAGAYTDEGFDIWLHSRNRNLGMRSPLKLIETGDLAPLNDEIARIQAGG